MLNSILFVSHEASRTGAPIVLLHFLKWLKQNTNIYFVILLKKDGELRSEFEAIAPTYLYPFPYTPLNGLKGKVIGNWNTYIGLPNYYKNLKKALEAHNIGLIYANSIESGKLLHFLSFLNCRVITHVHELEYAFHFTQKYNDPENFNYLFEYTNHYIAVANVVKKNLVEQHKIKEQVVDIVYEFVPDNITLTSNSSKIKQSLNIPDDAFIVGLSGTMDLRKGFDLLIQLVKEVYSQISTKDIYFIWVGGNFDSEYYFVANMDAERTNVNKFIRLIGPQKDPISYFSCFDIFTLLSREDPFPLVCLENALLSKPIICFEGGGGMPELVEENAGFVVPYLNISSMAQKIIYLKQNPSIRYTFGENAKKKVAHKYITSACAPQILNIIKKVNPGIEQPENAHNQSS
ncbi:glycosyltransferase family 4 protein [Xanthocytophaga agilis]|uniref:Glycosyltransferase family 4 protein n=1 Tax=Xanthocytophaga agilis TaxID=3048010 RepID=A0AAE3UHH5_9BACT|nr:glycosyltransferase family 4 protein [Xanthocytophaga agilis]MDJ1502653.1 glycosyltransferase family 4 protein [Xanthocytophaga agilis]